MATKLYSWAFTYPASASETMQLLSTHKKRKQDIPDLVDELVIQSDIANAAGGINIGNKKMLDDDDTGTGWILQAGERLTFFNIDPQTVYVFSGASLRLNCGAVKR